MESIAEQLHARGGAFADEFRQSGKRNVIDEAIDLDRQALTLRPPGHAERAVSFTRLAMHLGDRYDRFGSMSDLEEAIVLDREALSLRQQGHPDRGMSLNNLALGLSTRFKQLGDTEDLNVAIALSREAIEFLPKGHPNRTSSLLSNLGARLTTRHSHLGSMEDLNEAIGLHRDALSLRPKGHPDYPDSLNNLAAGLSNRYRQLGDMEDLKEAIVLEREGLDLHPTGHPDRAISLNNLADDLSARYHQLGKMEDLTEAIVLNQEAILLYPTGHPDRSLSLRSLARCLSTRYQFGVTEDLDVMIVLDREALSLCPTGHPDRSSSLNDLAADLSMRYKQFGNMEDLDQAIVLNKEALSLRPNRHPDWSYSSMNLAYGLFTRFKQLGVKEDLDAAIELDREALSLLPEGHPDRSGSLNKLADDLFTRYQELGAMEDLDEAIVLDREALHLCPKGHCDRTTSLTNLAAFLSTRCKQLEITEDLDEAILLNREAVDLLREGYSDRSESLNTLADCLSTRYKQLGTMGDLDEAISLSRAALGLRPQGRPDRSEVLDNLAGYLYLRFTRSKKLEDNEELFSLYAQLVDVVEIVSSSDLSAARAWVRVAEEFRHPTIPPAYSTALRNLSSSLAVDAFSACLRHRSPAKAVELLEQGRGVFWNQLTRLRSPLEDVIACGVPGKQLADEFSHLVSRIRNAIYSPGPDQHQQLCHLNLAMHRVVTNIRRLPGLSQFLLPSLFPDLRLAASEGPVIIVNASKHSCDAVVILLDRDPVHVPLKITRETIHDLANELHSLTLRATRADMTEQLAAFLRKLWDQIVSPIVDFLQTTLPSRSRIWWCPTGEFSVLPLHAAAPHRKGQPRLVDLYISSYTPTLTALIHARQHDPPTPVSLQKHFVAIGQANATGQNELPSVGVELANIGQLISDVATFTRIGGEESCISRVVEELGKNEWVHFACHGLPNRAQPFASAFALHDGRFTIQRIIGCDLKNPEFAYLSACHTTVGDEESPDEVIHLASAMQFIGFRSVIGTMWAVDDGETNKITSTFYKHMVDESGRLDHTRAAFALNRTMRTVDVPLDQRILYIHLGA